MDGDHLCRECEGTGWVLYRTERKDGEFEEAYRFCPKGHAPSYCMGFSGGKLCLRPATRRLGSGYYCEEHIVIIYDGRGASSRRSSMNTTPMRPNASSAPTSSNTSLPRAKSRASRA